MIIDCILDRHDGSEYNAKSFYLDMIAYGGYGEDISKAMDYGTEYDVKKALCEYIDGCDYNPDIKEYINSVEWLPIVEYKLLFDLKETGITGSLEEIKETYGTIRNNLERFDIVNTETGEVIDIRRPGYVQR